MPENRAINVNSLNGNLFPVTVEFSTENGIYRIHLTPISVLEIIDLLPYKTFLVFNVDTYEIVDSRLLTLAEIVDNYSSCLKEFDKETLLMEKKEVIQLLNEISHYNFFLIDAERDVELDKVIQAIDFADKWNEVTVITKVNSNLFLSSHDDCYLYLETSNKHLAFELAALQIKILVSTISGLSPSELKFDLKELKIQDELSIVIPQNPTKADDKICWRIFEGTFKEFVYEENLTESKFNLIYFEDNKEIKIEKD